jgi:hypothetical protein
MEAWGRHLSRPTCQVLPHDHYKTKTLLCQFEKLFRRDKNKNTLAGSHREDKSLLKYDDMKFPHCKIIDEQLCNPSSQNIEREKEKRKTHSGGWLPSCYFQLVM